MTKTEITAKPCASSRTKNRLREHGPMFLICRQAQTVHFAPGLWVLCDADPDADPDAWGASWRGWLPINEVNLGECNGE